MARETGVVKWFSVEKGYGFIRRERGEDVFVHHSEIQGNGFRTLKQGESVEFEVLVGDRGPRASAVSRSGSAAGPGPGGTAPRAARAAGSTVCEPATAVSPSRNGEPSGLRSLAAQIRERLGRRFLGFTR